MIGLKFIKSFFIIFINAKKNYLFPTYKDIVIYQKVNSEIFERYFYPDDLVVLDRNFSLNIPVLLLSFISCICHKSWTPYYRLFIKLTRAKCVLTFMHNDPDFYQLKESDDKVFISIQNGIILGKQTWLKEDRIYKSDYFLCFGTSTQHEFKNIIDTKFKSIGSFKNNIYSKNKIEEKENCITFISQYKLNRSIKEFFTIEKKILPYLNNYCKENKFIFKICGSNLNFAKEEKEFYQEIIKDDFIFLPKKNVDTSYKYLESSEINVAIDSTLGLESLASGHKTAIFMVRGKKLNLNNWYFGKHINNISENGPFWCIEDKFSEYDRILNYLKNIDIEKWQKYHSELISKIIGFDKDNSIFKDILLKNNVPHKNIR